MVHNSNLSLLRGLKDISTIDSFLDGAIETLLKQEIRHIRHQLDRTYSLAHLQHADQMRVGGAPYFSHLVEVAQIVLDELPDPTLEEITIALLHDIIEDTSITYTQIREYFGTSIATAVRSISKKNWKSYLSSDQKNTLSLLSKSEKKAYLCEMKPILKDRRNIQYFSHIPHLDTCALKVKCADRIHNLRTLDVYSPEKIQQKIDETVQYFLPTVEKKMPIAYDLLTREIDRLTRKYLS